ncbi:TMEM175 family protein [Mucilaginibacter sp. McL0603]|uniref:TMEM175 family protein n=1 Tax=Mucilaginibacter sp. McL0603 TaxID=3415670 RepID=UPI003CED7D15
MKKGRLEAFSDGVIAIIITIMVLEFKVPEHGSNLETLIPLAPFFLSYVVSFIYVGLYWNNHHHMFYIVDSISGGVLWANLFFLFWLSLMPFATEWMAYNHFAAGPVAVYGLVLMMCGLAYTLLANILASHCGKNSELAQALGRDWKGKASVVTYVIAIAVAFWMPVIS